MASMQQETALEPEAMVHADQLYEEEVGALYKQAVTSVSQVLIVNCVGCAVMMHLENWNFSKGIYWCIITMTSIGYGDLVPTHDESKWFTVFYILSSFFFVMQALSFLGTMPFGCVLWRSSTGCARSSATPWSTTS